jgi:hypothetical protein
MRRSLSQHVGFDALTVVNARSTVSLKVPPQMSTGVSEEGTASIFRVTDCLSSATCSASHSTIRTQVIRFSETSKGFVAT